MKVKHTTYLHIKFSQHIVIVKARLYRLTRNRMVLPRNRTRSARRLPFSLEQSHNSTGSALNDPTTQWAPHSKRERRLGTRQDYTTVYHCRLCGLLLCIFFLPLFSAREYSLKFHISRDVYSAPMNYFLL